MKKSQDASALRLQILCITGIVMTYDIGWGFIVLRVGRTHFGIFDGHLQCLFYFMEFSVRACTIRNFWRVFLVVILLYSVLRAGHTQLVSSWGQVDGSQWGSDLFRPFPQAAKHHFSFFPKMRYARSYEETNGKKIRLLKYPFAVNARDLKKLKTNKNYYITDKYRLY